MDFANCHNMSLKTKMALSVASLFVLFVFAASYFVLSYFGCTFKRSISAQQFSLVSSLADTIDDKLSIAQSALIALASTAPHDAMSDTNDAQRFVNGVSGFHTIFDNISLISAQGILIVESRFLPGRRGKNLSYRTFVKETLASKKPYISDPYLSTHHPVHPAIMMTVPILDESGNMTGMLAGSIDLLGKNFMADLSKIRIAKSGYLFMMDRNRIMIVYPDKRRVMKLAAPPGANALLDRAVAGFEGTGETVNTLGIPLLTSFKRLRTTSWILAGSYPTSEAYAPLFRAQHYFEIAAVASTVILLTITWLIMRRLLTPMAIMTRHVKLLSENPEQERHVPVNAVDEIGMLATAFNTMIDTLDSQRDSLQRQKNDIEDERTFLQTLIDAIPDMIFYKDLNSVYRGCNHAFAASLVGLPKDQIIGRSDYDLAATAEMAEFHQSSDQEAILKGGTDRHDLRVKLKEGRYLLTETIKVPFRDALGAVKGVIGISRDISERNRMEHELRILNTELERRVSVRTADLQRLNRELEIFCYSISHELRAPIARLMGFSGMLAESVAEIDPELVGETRSKELAHMAERIGVASLRLRSVIDSLLLMNRLSRAEIRRDQVNLSETADKIVAELLEATPGRMVTVKIAPDLVVQKDRQMLNICLRNLLSNAWKYTSKKEHTEIEFDRSVLSGEQVFFIRDNGAGFDVSFAAKLFEPFSRLHAEDEFEGSGMGLPTVQMIVERLGGRIWAEAEVGKGATFYFTLGDQ